jgi:hypothetical protein
MVPEMTAFESELFGKLGPERVAHVTKARGAASTTGGASCSPFDGCSAELGGETSAVAVLSLDATVEALGFVVGLL